MKITVKQGDLTKIAADLLVVNSFEGVKKHGGPPRVGERTRVEAGETGAVDQALGGLLSELITEEHFDGKEGETLLVHTHRKIPAKRVLVVGLGKQGDFSLEGVRRAAAYSIKKAKLIGAKNVASILHGTGTGGLDAQRVGQVMAEGALLADYQFVKYHAERREKAARSEVKEFTIVVRDADKFKAAAKGIEKGEIGARSTAYARDLVNETPSRMTPKHLASHAKQLTINNSQLTIKAEVFGEKKLEQMGAGGILGVSRGSDEEAFLIHLHYRPLKSSRLRRGLRLRGSDSRSFGGQAKAQKLKKIALVGKGITFDSGGLGIKPWDAMLTMKNDMSGAATILGVFSVLKELKPNIEIHGVIGATENMLGGKALKPGDVLTTMSGKTIEVLHTDAEGRIVLSDALTFANRLKPDEIIDLATLTGAAIVAVGELYGAAMTNNEPLLGQIKKAAEASGEPIWELPLPKDYADYLKSDVADLANIAKNKGAGGTIAGGLFLQEFVGKTPWVHLDIAGPVFLDKEHAGYLGKGATGFGTRLLLEYLTNY